MEALGKKMKEADVEARVIMPLLTAPEYLSIPHRNIKGKAYLTPQRIDKAAGRTSGYYPDFSIWSDAFPLAIVEAKAPGIDSEVGYREASLYALHLNRLYSKDINPCSYLLASNGQRLLGGFWNAAPEIDVAISDLVPGTAAVDLLRERLGYGALQQRSRELRQIASVERLYYAASGPQAQTLDHSRILPNQFASALVPTLARFFASASDDNDPAVYDRGYVPTEEQLSYDATLEALLRDRAYAHKNPLARDLRTTRYETKAFTDRVSGYAAGERNTAQLILVTGRVGAGKSLFIRRYKELLVPEQIRSNMLWSFLNFNEAPPRLEGAESWVARAFVESFEKENPSIDLYSEETLNQIFSKELRDLRSVYASVERADPVAAALMRAEDIKKWLKDFSAFSRGITRHFSGEKQTTCIVVFDNVDRLDKDDQLEAFQLALGFTADHRTLTVLQLRDETFERYKDKKPLDTYKAAVTFHVSPPRFGNVVRKRLEVAVSELQRNAPKDWEYSLASGGKG